MLSSSCVFERYLYAHVMDSVDSSAASSNAAVWAESITRQPMRMHSPTF